MNRLFKVLASTDPNVSVAADEPYEAQSIAPLPDELERMNLDFAWLAMSCGQRYVRGLSKGAVLADPAALSSLPQLSAQVSSIVRDAAELKRRRDVEGELDESLRAIVESFVSLAGGPIATVIDLVEIAMSGRRAVVSMADLMRDPSSWRHADSVNDAIGNSVSSLLTLFALPGHPLVIVVDDAHLVDDFSARLLASLATRRTSPVLIVLTMNPNVPASRGWRSLVSRTERGTVTALEPREGPASQSSDDPSIRAVRLGLDPAEISVLGAAALQGRQFSLDVLAGTLNAPVTEIQQLLRRPYERRVVLPAGEGLFQFLEERTFNAFGSHCRQFPNYESLSEAAGEAARRQWASVGRHWGRPALLRVLALTLLEHGDGRDFSPHPAVVLASTDWLVASRTTVVGLADYIEGVLGEPLDAADTGATLSVALTRARFCRQLAGAGEVARAIADLEEGIRSLRSALIEAKQSPNHEKEVARLTLALSESLWNLGLIYFVPVRHDLSIQPLSEALSLRPLGDADSLVLSYDLLFARTEIGGDRKQVAQDAMALHQRSLMADRTVNRDLDIRILRCLIWASRGLVHSDVLVQLIDVALRDLPERNLSRSVELEMRRLRLSVMSSNEQLLRVPEMRSSFVTLDDEMSDFFGVNHQQVLLLRAEFANWLMRAGFERDALSVGRALVAAHEEADGPQGFDTLIVKSHLATELLGVYIRAGESADLLKQSIALFEEVLPLLPNFGRMEPLHTALHNYGIACVRSNRLKDAQSALANAVEIRRNLLGADHSRTQASEQELGWVRELIAAETP